ncbi:MAG: RNA polymerase-associated protein RapA [Kangiellaceae bacterium]|nr:RNA polymerase-associated protein RapA [Kangiellaceae bacterium]
MNFVIGQRWISHTENHLGLGIVSDIDGRLVTISFPASAEERSYAINNAPLSRVIYKAGDQVNTMDELSLTISDVNERGGLIFYTGEDEQGDSHTIAELELDCFVNFNSPEQRLLANLFDSNAMYQLRVDTLFHTHRLQQSPVKGLLGTRTSLLPHQIYIASEVAKRFAPRVLLADEVGLGKTIEAGMILHQQLLTGLAERALIVVPDTLIHQWLVEMLRKFNLRFSIFDQARFDASLIESPEDNPFETEQLIICSLDFLTKHDEALDQALQAEWDLLIVDEAHHLQWSAEDESKVSEQYKAIEMLATISAGVLLLTATPEQMGIESHFARLRLLDPARFHDLSTFIEEEQGYQDLAEIVSQLIQLTEKEEKLSEKHFELLKPYLGSEIETIDSSTTEQTVISNIIEKLLDRHGTGRVLFRNTRSAIDDFPERQLYPVALSKPEHYAYHELYPELGADDNWTEQDPRVEWLVQHLKAIKPQKALVICANASTAKALEHYLHLKAGIRSAAFYEEMSIIERDSAAAYFADIEDGAQALVCSEIGSEGRNFQFAHHLVLFDLPLNPDLLEQRIGRLDRIGQLHPIKIHVPYFEQSAQQVLFQWLDQGLSQFTRSSSVGSSIYKQFHQSLHELLTEFDAEKLTSLVNDTNTRTEQLLKDMEQGRDPLLEYNSCRPVAANKLIELIEKDNDLKQVEEYATRLFDQFGLEQEEHSEHSVIVHPTDHMRLDSFPGLGDDSLTLTYDRQKAIAREDMAFATWEHPILAESMEMIVNSEIGNACIVTLPLKSIPAGTFLLESFHSVHYFAPSELQLSRYLPLSPSRTLVNLQGKNLSKALSFQQLNERVERMKKTIAQGVVPQIREQVEIMAKHAHQLAEQTMQPIIEQAKTHYQQAINAEIDRLKVLRKHNSGIREEEITFYEQHIESAIHCLDKATVRCEAIRVIITT